MDNKPSKFSKITKIVIWLMLFITVAGIVFSAFAALL